MENQLINTSQLAQILGISEQGIYRLSRENRLPVGIKRLEIGKAIRYRLSDVQALLSNTREGDSDAQ